jgi:hypothetical protein
MNNMAVVDYGATASTTPRKLFPGLPQLRHGILRQQHPSNDQPYVIVPAGYASGRPSRSPEQAICSALRLERWWPLLLLVVVANNDTHAANTAAESTMPESSSRDGSNNSTKRVDEMIQRLATYMAQLGSIWIMVRKEHHHHRQHYEDTVLSSQSMVGVGLTLLPNCNRPSESQRDDRVKTNETKPAVSSNASNTSTATVTRWVLFENETDARLFEHGLMIHTRVTTPTLLRVHGHHVTECAMSRIRALLRDDEDTTHIVLFPGTSPVVDDLCRALHAHPASEHEDNDRPGYDLERILMIGNDISTDQFLALVHETLDEAFSPWDAQIDALNQANGLLQTLGKHCFWQQCRTIVLHVQIMVGTLLAVAASVWYAHAYVGPPTLLTNTTQCTWFAATILIPILVTILERYAQSTAATNPMVAWCAFRKAIGALVSELFLFQSRAGCYSRTATNNSRKEATEAFVRQIYSIMASVSSFLPSSENANLPPQPTKKPRYKQCHL